jgi:hypothetical protein
MMLHLTIKKKWFDMIAAGIKREEYREIKPHWDKQINKPHNVIRMRNGYSKDSPVLEVELLGVTRGVGRAEWGAPECEVYILKLGKILKEPFEVMR